MRIFSWFTVLLLLSAAGAAGTWFIPAAANTAGAYGTNWRTEAVFVNPGATSVCANLFFLEANRDNSTAAAHPLEIPAGHAITLEDLVGTFFAAPGKAGAVRVEADGFLVITTRTYNDLGEGGTYGQGIPAIPLEDAIPEWEEVYIPRIISTPRFRTNLGFVNAGGTELILVFELFWGDPGGDHRTVHFRLPPHGYLQFNDPVAQFVGESLDEVSVYIHCASEEARYFAWASIVDNLTGDPLYLAPLREKDFNVRFPPTSIGALGLAGDDVGHAVTQILQYLDDDGNGYWEIFSGGETEAGGFGATDVAIQNWSGSTAPQRRTTILGGVGQDKLFTMRPASYNSSLLAGGTTSAGGGDWDAWVFFMGPWGDLVWQRFIGTERDEWIYSAYWDYTGYKLCGQIFPGPAPDSDAWAVRLDDDANIVWQKRYGGSASDWTYTLVPMRDGGSLLAGASQSFSGGNWDGWLIRIDKDGAVVWQRTYGGEKDDAFYGLAATHDGNFIAVGQTDSWGSGGMDVWIVKVDADGNLLWQTAIGTPAADVAYSVDADGSGGAVVAGEKGSYGPGGDDAWLVRVDALGAVVWQKQGGGSEAERLYGVEVLVDGSIAAVGRTSSMGAGGKDILSMHLSADGEAEAPCDYLRDSAAEVHATSATVRDVNGFSVATSAVTRDYVFSRSTLDMEDAWACEGYGKYRFSYLVPAVASTGGANGTNWKSDLSFINWYSGPARMHFLEAGTDGTEAPWLEMDLSNDAPFHSFEDLVRTLFGKTDTYGSLLIESFSPLKIFSRTYNDLGEQGTYGQYLPAAMRQDAFAKGETVLLSGLVRNAGFRTNVGFVNAAKVPIQLSVEVYDAGGLLLGESTVDLKPLEPLQINDFLGQFSIEALTGAWAKVSSESENAAYFAYASVADNRTGDPIYIPAVRLPLGP